MTAALVVVACANDLPDPEDPILEWHPAGAGPAVSIWEAVTEASLAAGLAPLEQRPAQLDTWEIRLVNFYEFESTLHYVRVAHSAQGIEGQHLIFWPSDVGEYDCDTTLSRFASEYQCREVVRTPHGFVCTFSPLPMQMWDAFSRELQRQEVWQLPSTDKFEYAKRYHWGIPLFGELFDGARFRRFQISVPEQQTHPGAREGARIKRALLKLFPKPQVAPVPMAWDPPDAWPDLEICRGFDAPEDKSEDSP